MSKVINVNIMWWIMHQDSNAETQPNPSIHASITTIKLTQRVSIISTRINCLLDPETNINMHIQICEFNLISVYQEYSSDLGNTRENSKHLLDYLQLFYIVFLKKH
jgi:hypothetical protein